MPDLATGLFSNFQIGLLSFPLLIALIFLRIPLAASMFIVGLLGTWLLAGDMRMMNNQLKTFAFGTLTNYSFSIIPLFLLMSEFATRAGMSRALFKAAEAWLGHRRGGVDQPTSGSQECTHVCSSAFATKKESYNAITHTQTKNAAMAQP